MDTAQYLGIGFTGVDGNRQVQVDTPSQLFFKDYFLFFQIGFIPLEVDPEFTH